MSFPSEVESVINLLVAARIAELGNRQKDGFIHPSIPSAEDLAKELRWAIDEALEEAGRSGDGEEIQKMFLARLKAAGIPALCSHYERSRRGDITLYSSVAPEHITQAWQIWLELQSEEILTPIKIELWEEDPNRAP